MSSLYVVREVVNGCTVVGMGEQVAGYKILLSEQFVVFPL